MDINVLPVWKKGITGKGVVVSILDDGRSNTYINFWPSQFFDVPHKKHFPCFCWHDLCVQPF